MTFALQLLLQDGGGRRAHQALPQVQSVHREGRGLRSDDVQELQTRLLLVLSGVPGCECNPLPFIIKSFKIFLEIFRRSLVERLTQP